MEGAVFLNFCYGLTMAHGPHEEFYMYWIVLLNIFSGVSHHIHVVVSLPFVCWWIFIANIVTRSYAILVTSNRI